MHGGVASCSLQSLCPSQQGCLKPQRCQAFPLAGIMGTWALLTALLLLGLTPESLQGGEGRGAGGQGRLWAAAGRAGGQVSQGMG